jgi:predicted AlkP superfamily phosphohydrolase/phosphomutase
VIGGNTRVAVIGLDCAPPQLVFEDFLDDMPNLASLVREGLWGPLRSSDPPITVPAWSCMVTGKNPGRLGFYGFRNRKPGTYHDLWIANSAAVREKTVWDVLSHAGKRCCVIGVPQTYPPKALNGCLITSFLTPDTSCQYTYPTTLAQEISSWVGQYWLDVDDFRTDDKGQLLEKIYRMTETRFEVARRLLKRERWDFFMMVEMGPDRIHHGLWKFHDPAHRKFVPESPYGDAIRQYYLYLDREIGSLLELLGEDTAVMVVSDHGAKRMEGSFNVNDWLVEAGYLVLKEKPSAVGRLKGMKVDWSRTRAWAWGGYYSRVFLNVKGREPEGLIERASYERERDRLQKDLEELTDDRGRRMDTRAIVPQDIYTGPYVSEAPDLMVYFDDLYWRATEDLGHDSLYSFETEVGPDDAVHDYNGICIAKAPGKVQPGRRDGLEIKDVASTILHLVAGEVPADMEGHIQV